MNLAVTAIGRDRPGIVAGITAALLEVDGNVDDSQMSILHGQFAVMLIVSVPDGTSTEELSARLEEAGREFGLGAITVSPVESLERGPMATHVLTVYGADRPGIVHDVADLLAARAVNITDLRTRRTGGPADMESTKEARSRDVGGAGPARDADRAEGTGGAEGAVYTLMMEVAIPEGSALEETTAALTLYGANRDVEVNLTELDAESL